MELVGAVEVTADRARALFALRPWHHDRIVRAARSVRIPIGAAVHAGTVSAAAGAAAGGRTSDAPARVRRWVARHGQDLLAGMSLPEPPYPPGTCGVVDVGDYRRARGGRPVADGPGAGQGPDPGRPAHASAHGRSRQTR
jgi:hypothetical protein